MKKAHYYFTQVAKNEEAMEMNREYAEEMLDRID